MSRSYPPTATSAEDFLNGLPFKRGTPRTSGNRRNKRNLPTVITPKAQGIEFFVNKALGQIEKYVTEEWSKYQAQGKFSVKISQVDSEHEYNKCLAMLVKHGFSEASNRRTVKHDWPKSYLMPAQDTETRTTIDGIDIKVKLFSGDSPSTGNNTTQANFWRTLELIVDTDDRDALIRLLDREVMYVSEENTGLEVFIYNGRRHFWSRVIQTPRPLETVVLPVDQKARITNDINSFLDSKERYGAVGLPWHRGYLLHGEPGTGKSALAKAIASHWGMGLYVLNLGELQGDFDLTAALSEIEPKSILLLEDIDVFSQTRRESNENNQATFAGLLNALDGVFTPNGLIKIMTSNSDVSTFDEALIRDGRVDLIEHVGHADAEQVAAILSHFYTDNVRPVNLSGQKISPAKVVGVIKRNPDDVEVAIAEIETSVRT